MRFSAFLKHGLKKKLYENRLAHRLTKQGIAVQQQCSLDVFDEDNFHLGTLEMDLAVEDELIIELKAVKNLTHEHVAQLLGSIHATR